MFLPVHGNMSKESILKRTEQIGCQVFGTEQIRCQGLRTEQIRCFLDFTRLTEQVGYKASERE